MTAPAPATVPLSEAMTGLFRARMLRINSQVMRVNSSSPLMSRLKSSPIMSSTSPPEQNPRPRPVITTTRTSSRLRSEAKVSVSSRYTSKVNEFNRSGRSSVTTATGPNSSYEKLFGVGRVDEMLTLLITVGSRGYDCGRFDLDFGEVFEQTADFDERHRGKVFAHQLPVRGTYIGQMR